MIWVYIFWPLSFIFALVIGVAYRNLLTALEDIRLKLKEAVKPQQQRLSEPVNKAVIIDPTDLEQQVKMEQEDMLRRLNPEMYDEQMSDV